MLPFLQPSKRSEPFVGSDLPDQGSPPSPELTVVPRNWGGLASTEPKPPGNGPARSAAERRLRQTLETCHDFSWRTMQRMGLSPADAEDAVQRVFIIVARKLDGIEAGREASFVFATSLRVASETRRTLRRRYEDLPGELNEVACAHPSPEANAHRRGLLGLLGVVLDRLPNEQREVFILHELEQCTQAEIAELLAVPAGTVASRLRRARRAFEKQVARLPRSLREEAR
ncbi:MAG: RNA polymerase sigma factor [Polyangiaceae bacterium]|nr:RNA polymerase sigma factor [Polyangiaceae bacterium]